VSRDTWAGDINSPASLNRFAYVQNNPIIYTDPSGNHPVVAALLPGIIGAAAGFGIGVLAGGAFGYAIYPWALSGECGCELQDLAEAASGDRYAFAWALAFPAGILGGIGGAMAAYGPVGLIGAGTLGLILSGADFVHTWNIIQNETGWTPCTLSRLLLDALTFAFSAKATGVGIIKAVKAWKSGGSLLKWTTNPPKIESTSRVSNGIKAVRVRIGSSSKVAVIGRNMVGRVAVFAKGIGAEYWTGFKSSLSESANLANNRAWAAKLVREGYTVYDVGLDPKYMALGDYSKGPFYRMETQVIFGDP